MKYLLLLISLSANADCFYDAAARSTICTPQAYQGQDYRQSYNSPQLYQNGEYRGNLNNNRYDPNSVSNPYGRYGSPYSQESINNPYRYRW